MTKFGIFHQIYPATTRPYKLCETVITSDGPRTRVCDGTWKSLVDVQAELNKREEVVRALLIARAS